MLGHKVSEKGIEVDKVNVDMIFNSLVPISMKQVRSFLGHAGFYRIFMRIVAKWVNPLLISLLKMLLLSLMSLV